MRIPLDGQPDASAGVVTDPLLTMTPGRLYYDWAADGSGLVMVNGQSSDGPAYLVDAATGEMEPLGWGTPEWPSWQAYAG